MKKQNNWPPDYEIDAKGTARRLEQMVEDIQNVLEDFRYGRNDLSAEAQESLCRAVNRARGITK